MKYGSSKKAENVQFLKNLGNWEVTSKDAIASPKAHSDFVSSPLDQKQLSWEVSGSSDKRRMNIPKMYLSAEIQTGFMLACSARQSVHYNSVGINVSLILSRRFP